MACESEKFAVESAKSNVSYYENECALIAMEFGINDTQYLTCKIFWDQAQEQLSEALRKLSICEQGGDTPSYEVVGVGRRKGFVTYLRVHDLRSGYGPSNNKIEGEVVFKLSTSPDRAFGFELRQDDYYPARNGMLELLRDAFANGLLVATDFFETEPPKTNAQAFRIELTRPGAADEEDNDPGSVLDTLSL